MITLPEFEPFRQQYATLPMAGLKITAVYKSGASRQNYDPGALDGLLGSQVVKQAMNGVDLPTVFDAYDIPLPLQCLWRNESGWPLWAASYFWPESETLDWSAVFHKRAITGHWSAGKGAKHQLSINKAAGRHKEKRIPVPAQTSVTGRYVAWCIGNAGAIEELLNGVTMFSGRRGVGLGAINHWEIEPADIQPVDCLAQNGVLLRAISAGAAHLLPAQPVDYPYTVGWTPPQWKPTLFGDGWRAGACLEVDWFNAAA